MNNILISVLMSTKDTDEKMLKASVESILNQTYRNFEFLIICDGSIRDYNILSQYNDPRIKIICHNISIGLTKSLNELLNIANGKYIARMDSDDVSLVDRFETQLRFMESNPNIDICSTMIKNFGNNNNISINLYDDSDGVKSQLFLYNCLAHPTIMMRKSFVLNNNIRYDENFKYSQDYELWSRCSKFGKLCIINKICLLYRTHNNQISTSKLDEQNALCSFIYARNLKELGINPNNECINKIFNICGKSLKYSSLLELIEFINDILIANSNEKIYNQRKFENVLYLKLFTILLRNNEYTLSLKFY